MSVLQDVLPFVLQDVFKMFCELFSFLYIFAICSNSDLRFLRLKLVRFDLNVLVLML